MRSRPFAIAAVVAVLAATLATGAAGAAPKAVTKVTIKVVNGEFSGRVVSPRPKRCADERRVWVFEQLGPQQDPKNDDRLYMDTASLNGDRYQWNTGNTGTSPGMYYARVVATPLCKADNSRTVQVT